LACSVEIQVVQFDAKRFGVRLLNLLLTLDQYVSLWAELSGNFLGSITFSFSGVFLSYDLWVVYLFAAFVLTHALVGVIGFLLCSF